MTWSDLVLLVLIAVACLVLVFMLVWVMRGAPAGPPRPSTLWGPPTPPRPPKHDLRPGPARAEMVLPDDPAPWHSLSAEEQADERASYAAFGESVAAHKERRKWRGDESFVSWAMRQRPSIFDDDAPGVPSEANRQRLALIAALDRDLAESARRERERDDR